MKKIKTFANKETEKIYNQEYVKSISKNVQEMGLRKLIMMDAAESIQDLRIPPGNRLEKLLGDYEGKYSIRINGRYRIVFREEESFFYDVKIEDYH